MKPASSPTSIPYLTIASTIRYYLKDGAHVLQSFGINKFNKEIHIEDFTVLSNEGAVSKGAPIKTDHYALILAIRGTCIKTVGYHRFAVTPHSIHLAAPNQITSFDEVSPDLLLYMILFKKEFLLQSHIQEQVLDDLLYQQPDYPPFYELSDSSFESIKTGFEYIDSEVKQQSPFHLHLVRLRVLELLYEMNRACEACLIASTRRLTRKYQLVMEFRQLVEAHFQQHKTVQEYADMLNITPKYLSESVKEETGETALDLIHRRILLEAQYLLKYSGHSIKEIAMQLNFDTSSHFARFYKQKTLKTPAQYRKQP